MLKPLPFLAIPIIYMVHGIAKGFEDFTKLMNPKFDGFDTPPTIEGEIRACSQIIRRKNQ